MKQNKKTIIGITGGIATGKSTVTEILKDKKFKVIDADYISKEILQLGQSAYQDVVGHFGMEILQQDCSINRTLLATKIFKDEVQREKLNSIMHPYIIEEMKKEIIASKEEILFLDIPLLIEIYELLNNEIKFTEIWLVYCNKEIEIKRLMERDNIDYKQAEMKINAQIDIEEKKKQADRIINNEGDKVDLIEQLEMALKQIS